MMPVSSEFSPADVKAGDAADGDGLLGEGNDVSPGDAKTATDVNELLTPPALTREWPKIGSPAFLLRLRQRIKGAK